MKATTSAARKGLAFLPMAALLVVSALALQGCNTVSGVGKDVSATGSALDTTSERTKEEMFNSDQPSSTYSQPGSSQRSTY